MGSPRRDICPSSNSLSAMNIYTFIVIFKASRTTKKKEISEAHITKEMGEPYNKLMKEDVKDIYY